MHATSIGRGERPGSGMLRVVDVAARRTAGRVAGAGSETCLLALQP